MEMWRIMLIKIHVYDNSVKAAYLRHICFPSNWLHRKYTNFSNQSKCHPIIHVSFVLFSVCQRTFRPPVQSGDDKCSWRPATSISVMPGTDRASRRQGRSQRPTLLRGRISMPSEASCTRMSQDNVLLQLLIPGLL